MTDTRGALNYIQQWDTGDVYRLHDTREREREGHKEEREIQNSLLH